MLYAGYILVEQGLLQVRWAITTLSHPPELVVDVRILTEVQWQQAWTL